MDTTRKTNAWWEFVKQNKHLTKDFKTKKEKFTYLSELWQNKKASIITMHAEDLMDMHQNITELKKTIQELVIENNMLKERLAFFEDGMEE